MARATRAAMSAIDISLSVDPDPSGVRLSDHDDEPDVYLGDDDEDDLPTHFTDAFLGDDDEAATKSVWDLFVKDSIRNGHAPDIAAERDAAREKCRPIGGRVGLAFGRRGSK